MNKTNLVTGGIVLIAILAAFWAMNNVAAVGNLVAKKA
jgi:hypothetical protein